MKNQIMPIIVGVFCLFAFTVTALAIQETIAKGETAKGALREIHLSRLPLMFLVLFVCVFVFVMIIIIMYDEYKSAKALKDLKNETQLNSFETTLGQAE